MEIKHTLKAFALFGAISASQATEVRHNTDLICGPMAPPEHQIQLYFQATDKLNSPATTSVRFAHMLEWGATFVSQFTQMDPKKDRELARVISNIRKSARNGEIALPFYLMANTQFAVLMTDKLGLERKLHGELLRTDWTNTQSLLESFQRTISANRNITDLDKFFNHLASARGSGGHCVVYYDPAFLTYETFNKCLLRDNQVTLSVLSTQGEKAHNGIHPTTLDFYYHDILHSNITRKFFEAFPQFVAVLRQIYFNKKNLTKVDHVGIFLLIHEFSLNWRSEDKATTPLIPVGRLAGAQLNFAQLINWAYGYIQKSQQLNPTAGAISYLLNRQIPIGLFNVETVERIPNAQETFRASVTLPSALNRLGEVVVKFEGSKAGPEHAIILNYQGFDNFMPILPTARTGTLLPPSKTRASFFSFHEKDMSNVVRGLPSLKFDAKKPREDELRRCLTELLKQFYAANKGNV